MTKEEFLAMSLPHELKGFVDDMDSISGPHIYTLHSVRYKTSVVEVFGESDLDTDRFRPLLHPLSDYTKYSDSIPFLYQSDIRCVIMGNRSIDFLSFGLIQFLVKHHFDLADLIEKGEAINVNTLPTNPYE